MLLHGIVFSFQIGQNVRGNSMEWQWMCEHWYLFSVLLAVIIVLFFIAGCMLMGSISSRAEERINDMSSEEYRQNDVEHGKEGRL